MPRAALDDWPTILTWHADIRAVAEDGLVPRLAHALVVGVGPDALVVHARAPHHGACPPPVPRRLLTLCGVVRHPKPELLGATKPALAQCQPWLGAGAETSVRRAPTSNEKRMRGCGAAGDARRAARDGMGGGRHSRT